VGPEKPRGYAAAGRPAGARRAGGRTGLLRLWARAGPVSAAAAGLAAGGTGCGEDGTSAAGHSGGPDELTEGSGHEERRGLPRHCESAIGHLGEAQLLTTGAATRCGEDCRVTARPPSDISGGQLLKAGAAFEVRRGLPRHSASRRGPALNIDYHAERGGAGLPPLDSVRGPAAARPAEWNHHRPKPGRARTQGRRPRQAARPVTRHGHRR
jgi:hypothetical protein